MAKKTKSPPSLTVVVTCGVLTALLGALLGIISLATQSVFELKEPLPPERQEAGMVYFVKGSPSSSARWRALRSQILAGTPGTIKFDEGDLNSWANSMLVLSSPNRGEEGESEAVPGLFGLKVNVTGVNFRMEGDELQVAAYLEFPALASGKRFTYQARGSFDSGWGGLKFQPDEGTLGRAEIVSIPFLGSALNKKLIGLFTQSPEWGALSEAWGKVASVEIAEGQATLTLN